MRNPFERLPSPGLDPRFAVGATSWPDLRRLLAERRRLARLLPFGGTRNVTAYCVLLLLAALAPSAMALLTGQLVTATAAPSSPGPWAPGTLPLLVAIAVVYVVQQSAEAGQQVLRVAIARRIDGTVRARVRELTLQPSGLSHLEQPDLQDDLNRLWDTGGMINRTRSPGTATAGIVVAGFQILGALVATAVVFTFSPLLAIGLLVATLLIRAINRRQWHYLTDVADGRARYRRQVNEWSELAAGPAAAKEVRLFGLGAWATARRRRSALAWAGPIWAVRRDILRKQGTTMVLSVGAGFAGLAVPGLAAASGGIGIDDLVVYLVAVWGIFSARDVGTDGFDIEYGLGAIRALDRLIERYERLGAEWGARPRPTAVLPGGCGDPPAAPHIRFEDVRFTYPGSPRPTLNGVNLTIEPGELLAIVGYNGAGKTTLIKLLSGLYRPSRGRIVVDDTNLADLDEGELSAWRRRMTVLFQDFVRYPGSIADNITLSAPESLDLEREAAGRAVADAAGRAGMDDLLASAPEGLETRLREGGAGSLGLSGGQWQRLATARALFAVGRGRRLLVLDEPTAHLDVRAEEAFFDQVVREVRGASVVLISHRLSTVRHAGRIALLRSGRIAEIGTHEELLDRDGDYARLFRLQAGRFQTARGGSS
ncbi:ABC transporter ATP-binding protein [Nonomuraea mesophila]|uniref:ABC transporter ATP-binding protein n=1 Tax=Nonomuraea mesophila TaxID=2530382 RepID=A0A4R5EH73_9ACTN|nr:ABC transporter ATP-binding protein [Nonomuraea mesophila]TDE33623.1 ABC transporter ATP-binding protein [Nonomuraea mesophila]